MVADFGIALAVSAAGHGRMTETGLSLGTPHYMSPEQATGDRELDGRSDVYSLGCVLYEMVVGAPPFGGSGRQAVLLDHLMRTPPDVRRERSDAPSELQGILRTALQKAPEDRYESATAVLDALDELNDREKEVVRLRFGLDDGRPRTLEEVGRMYGVTRERIRQIESKTLAKLRHPQRSDKLRDYLDGS